MQTDGRLVLAKRVTTAPTTWTSVWSQGSTADPGSYLQLQTDGNLVLRKPDVGSVTGAAIWSTSTFAASPVHSTLTLQHDGRLTINTNTKNNTQLRVLYQP